MLSGKQEIIAMAKGIYRTKTPDSGAEYAFVDYGTSLSLGEIPRAHYEANGYEPRFDDLPTKEAYEAAQASKAKS